MSGITFNPALQTNAKGSFYVTSEGYVQGVFLDDPAIRNELVSGILISTATNPIWGGCAITELLANPANQSDSIQSVVQLATAETNITGFTVFNQAAAMIQAPGAPVPLAPQTGGVNFFRLGSGARIVVACTAAVAANYQGLAVNTAVYWDYTNQVLLDAPGGTALPVKIVDVNVGNSLIVATSAGAATGLWTATGSTAVIQI
jgi:hypothetical protein